MTETPIVVVEVRGPQRSGVTTVAELLTRYLRTAVGAGVVRGPRLTRMRFELVAALERLGTHVEVREADEFARDRELMGLKLQVPRLQQEVERLRRQVEDLDDRLIERMAAQERSGAALGAERAAHSLTQGRVEELLKSYGEATDRNRGLQAKFDRLLVAFHDATRRHLGVTPDSGDEFYDHRMADEAEARRVRYGRGR